MVAEEISIRWTDAEPDLQGAIALRERVFCGEQGVPQAEERDGLDDVGHHLVALAEDGREVIGTLRLLINGDVAKIGRVAVESSWRRQRVASRMLDLALARACELGCRRARLASQLEATRVYEQAGFSVESAPFMEAGIAHVWMGCDLVHAG